MKSIDPIGHTRRLLNRGQRMKPRLKVVRGATLLLWCGTFAAGMLLLFAPPFKLAVSIFRGLGIDPDARGASLSEILYFLPILLVFLLAFAALTLAAFAFAKWYFVRVGLMTSAEAREFYEVDTIPDSWIDDDSPPDERVERLSRLLYFVILALAVGVPPLLYVLLRHAGD